MRTNSLLFPFVLGGEGRAGDGGVPQDTSRPRDMRKKAQFENGYKKT